MTANDQFSTGEVNKVKANAPLSIVKSVIGGAIGAFILSWIYALCTYHSPLVYLNLLVVFCYGWLVGAICRGLLRRFRISRRVPAMVVGIICGLLAVWFGWLAYIYVISDYSFEAYTDSLFDPAWLWYVIQLIANNPIWTIGKSGEGMPAIIYYALWAVECVAIIFLSASACTGFTAKNKLCEKCNDWLGETGESAYFEIPECGVSKLKTGLAAGDFSELLALPRVAENNLHLNWLQAKNYQCTRCGDAQNDNFVTVSEIKVKVVKGEEKGKAENILGQFLPVTQQLKDEIFTIPQEEQPEEAEERPTEEQPS